jgi:hypothetical protein
MNTRPLRLASAGLLAATLLGGCSAIAVSEKSGRIKLLSDPAGATAYADGRELGTTPLEIVPGEHFPSGFVGLSYRYYGKLSFRKPGCEPTSIDVNDAILAKDVHAELKCDPAYRPTANSSPAQAAPAADPYTERLERIEALHRKGLISDEEYQGLRKRILEQL